MVGMRRPRTGQPLPVGDLLWLLRPAIAWRAASIGVLGVFSPQPPNGLTSNPASGATAFISGSATFLRVDHLRAIDDCPRVTRNSTRTCDVRTMCAPSAMQIAGDRW